MRRQLTYVLPVLFFVMLCAVLGMPACIPGSIADQLPFPSLDMAPIPPIDFADQPDLFHLDGGQGGG